MSPSRAASRHGHDAVAVHRRLEGARRLHLGHDHVCAQAARAAREPASAPPVPGHDHVLAGEQHVGGADDAVDGGLARPVAIVEQVLGISLVDRDDRIGERAVGGHRAQADHAGRRLLGAADDAVEEVAALAVEHRHEVRAVVHRHLRAVAGGLLEVAVVGGRVLALDRECRHAELCAQRRGDVVLRRERVRGAESHLGAAVAQREHEVRGLRGDVQAGADAHAREGPLLGEAAADAGDHRHLARGPLDAAQPLGGEGRLCDVALDGRGHDSLRPALPSSRRADARTSAAPSSPRRANQRRSIEPNPNTSRRRRRASTMGAPAT